MVFYGVVCCVFSTSESAVMLYVCTYRNCCINVYLFTVEIWKYVCVCTMLQLTA